MNPTLATGIALACASVVCLFLWFQQRIPDITSNALLVRAEAWDTSSAETVTGIIVQKVSITTPHQRLERSIYRDIEGRRRAKQVKLADSEEHLKGRLATAGLNWDEPLSAAGYQDWHDRQRVREDQITRAGKHLLRLTTTIPTGAVAAQSLTVRDTDFHPVGRTVSFRDTDPIEIAELDYRVLPWASAEANAFAFEPELRTRPDAFVSTDSSLPHFHLPALVTEAQIDEAELGARLVLNHLHADTGEQLQIVRNARGVEVKGLVETEQRRLELQSELRSLPHIIASILSVEDLKRRPDSEPGITSLKMASASARPSPLEMYFTSHGRSADRVSGLSHQLLDSALAVNQESKALTELLNRFSGGEEKERMTALTTATLAELIFSHRQRLLEALEEERRLLAEAEGVPVPSGLPSTPASGMDLLERAAERNLALCKELTLGNNVPPRSADAILAELAVSVNELRKDARQAQTKSAALGGRK